MKKGCLIGILVVVLLSAIAAIALAAVYYAVDKRVGLSAAHELPWAEHVPVTKETAALARIDTCRIGRCLAPALDKVPFPKWLTWYGAGSAGRAIADSLPHRIVLALNIRPDLSGAGLSVFVNEQRFGKLMQEVLTYDFLARTLPQVKWNTEGALLAERGVLTIDGTLSIPPDVEPLIQEKWSGTADQATLTLDDQPQIDISIDNRTGQLLAIAGMIAEAQNQDFKALAQSGYGTMVMGLLPEIYSIRLQATLKDSDTAAATLRVNTSPNGQSLFLLLSGFWPMVPENARSRFGLTVEGEPAWNAAENAIVADLKITGIENLVISRLSAALPAAK
ncbi:MAG TPA: hypothetical protein PLX03_01385 [Candidatus Hydrogenedentes bacterium]|nr:hypothetical protein [Candidatus Hydrogenedentota bacterium]